MSHVQWLCFAAIQKSWQNDSLVLSVSHR